MVCPGAMLISGRLGQANAGAVARLLGGVARLELSWNRLTQVHSAADPCAALQPMTAQHCSDWGIYMGAQWQGGRRKQIEHWNYVRSDVFCLQSVVVSRHGGGEMLHGSRTNCLGTPMRPSNLGTYSRGRFQSTCQLRSGGQSSAVVAQVTSCLLWAASRQDACVRGAQGPTAQGGTHVRASIQSATAGPCCLCGRRPPHITSRKATGQVMMCSLLRFRRRLKHPVPRPARCFNAQLVRLHARQPSGISKGEGAHWRGRRCCGTCARHVRTQATEGLAAVEAAGPQLRHCWKRLT